ncbi:large ribosomal subunit protein uL30y-like [Aristolochia californica]|uniref:large ribosomal subunit protein uL30y-like n=1 Tax=Aristolochia californica TaxID=171875 RepID=UPI0035D67B2A
MEEPKPLDFVPEVVLKKRKKNEEWAIKRREQLDARKRSRKEDQKLVFKRAEQFVKEYRDKHLDFVLMKQRRKRRRLPSIDELGGGLLFVIRINGKNDMHPKTRKVLNRLRLRHICSGVFLQANESIMKMLISVEPYITYGCPNLKSVKELVYKKGYGKVDKQKVPLTDNNMIEEALGKSGIICIEDIVHEIAKAGPHFKEVTSFLWPFKLNKPEGGLGKKKALFRVGGDAGDRQDKINELISKMN